MPIYEYECQDCGHKLEVMQRISEEALKTCPSCARESLRKLISAVGFQLKGTGWYETDFKHKGKAKSGNGTEKEGSPTSAATESKTETATDPKKSDSAKSTDATASTSSD